MKIILNYKIQIIKTGEYSGMKIGHFLHRVWSIETEQRRISIIVCKICNDNEIGDYLVLTICGNYKMLDTENILA